MVFQNEHGNVAYNDDRERLIHTDGTGFISEDLMKKCPAIIIKGMKLQVCTLANSSTACLYFKLYFITFSG